MGAARGVYTAIEKMGRSKGGQGGRIINITSVSGLTVCIYCSFNNHSFAKYYIS